MVKERLEWLEDATNLSDNYRRNRLRRKLASLQKSNPELAKKLLSIHHSLNSTGIGELTDEVVNSLTISKSPFELSRSKFIHLEPIVRREVVMQIIRRLAGESLSNINRQTILKTEHFICTARAFKNYSPAKGLLVVVDNTKVKISKNR